MIPVAPPLYENEPLRQRYAARIRASREGKYLTQAQLGKLAGLHRSYVSQVERGVINVSLDNLEKFQSALELNVAQDARPLRTRLGDRLRAARARIGASQEELAELAKVPVLYVSRVERGVVGTSLDQIEKLASALRIDGESLLE